MKDASPSSKKIQRTSVNGKEWEAGTSNSRARTLTLAVLLVSTLVLGALLGGAFKVRTVQVVGNELPFAAIAAESGASGQNILAVQSDRVIHKLSRLHVVVVTKVETDFPDKLVVYAHLRPAVAAWKSSRGVYLLASDGTRMNRVISTTLPMIRGGSDSPSTGIIAAARYARQALPAVASGRIQALHVRLGKGLVIIGHDGWSAVIGNGTAHLLVTRVAILKGILAKLAGLGQQLSHADLRYSSPDISLK